MKTFTISAMFIIGLVISISLYHGDRIDVSAAPGPQSATVREVAKAWDAEGTFSIPKNTYPVDEKKKWALLRDIMECESNSRWKVEPVPGYGQDVGPCQINTYWHVVEAARMSYDLFIPSENMLYCIDLFEEYYEAIRAGEWSPWENSKACWTKIQEARGGT